jgi:hypothetical protein
VSREEVDIRVNINKADSSPTSEWNVVRYVTRSSQINCVLCKRQIIVPEPQPQRKGNYRFFRKKINLRKTIGCAKLQLTNQQSSVCVSSFGRSNEALGTFKISVAKLPIVTGQAHRPIEAGLGRFEIEHFMSSLRYDILIEMISNFTRNPSEMTQFRSISAFDPFNLQISCLASYGYVQQDSDKKNPQLLEHSSIKFSQS